MRTFSKITTILAAVFYIAFDPIMAQQIITVSGQVLHLHDNTNQVQPFPDTEKVDILAFNTVEEAQASMKVFQQGVGTLIPYEATNTDNNGYYQIQVATNGALIFSIGITRHMEEVNGRDSINCQLNTSIALSPIQVFAGSPPYRHRWEHTIAKMLGNYLYLQSSILLPKQFASKNTRVTLQPYLVNRKTQDTVYTQPWIVKGEKFDLDKDKRNVLLPINKIRKKYIYPKLLTGEHMDVLWQDTLCTIDPQINYEVNCLLTFENARRIVKEWNMCIAKRIYRPLQFLEYTPFFENISGASNDEAATIKQLLALLQTYNYSEALLLSKTLPEKQELQTVKAFVYYLCNDYLKQSIEDKQQWKAAFELIKASSPINHVVVCLAMQSHYYDRMACEVVEQLPATAIGFYLKSILYDQIYGLNMEMGTEQYLVQAFKIDSQLIEIAANDIDISKELYEWALEVYKNK